MSFTQDFPFLRPSLLGGAFAAALIGGVALGPSAHAEDQAEVYAEDDADPFMDQNLAQNKLSDAIAACGNIRVKSDAKCTVIADPPKCELECTPLKLQAACAVELQASCSGGCNASIETTCTQNCQDVCLPKCELNPGSFSCSAECSANLDARCSASCQGKAEASPGNANAEVECQSACKAEFQAQCSAGCTGEAPNLSCQQKCAKVCVPDCQAQANLDCQIDCQAKGSASCQATMEGGCKGKCSKGEGALFCDGQFVNTQEVADGLKNCVGALNGILTTKVQGYADVNCDGNGKCEAKAGVSCDVAPHEQDSDRRWLLGLLVLPGAFAWTRRQRRAK